MAIDGWPELPYEPFADTRDVLHMWTQVVGKVKLALCPYLNEWWEVALHPSARGLTSGLIPWGEESFEMEFDFVAHRLAIRTAAGEERTVTLAPKTVSAFHAEVMAALASLGVEPTISTLPAELPGEPVPFEDDDRVGYDAAAVERWWHALLAIERVIQRYRTPFSGKSSGALFFWGGFDLAHARFSGRPAPPEPGTNPILAYGEDQENVAIGFWPGSREFPHPLLYAYIHPAPDGIAGAPIEPAAARWEPTLGEFVLTYADALATGDPAGAIAIFFQSAYELCAGLSGWDREALEGAVPGE
ncbi:MAG: DUF5996 family protein [Solirubrobacteraceae bacterium]